MNKKVKWVGILSTAERNHIGLIRVRQNNVNSEVLGFEIIDGNGEPYDLKNRKVLFCTYFDRFAPVEQYAEVIENGKIIYTMNEHDMQKPVRINFAYFKIMDEKDNLVDTTQNFSYDIMPSIESKCGDFGPYIIRLEEVLDAFNGVKDEAMKEMQQIIINFNEQVIKQQQDFDFWFESVRDILESIDPGGILLSEIIKARNGEKDLNTRLDKQYNYLLNGVENLMIENEKIKFNQEMQSKQIRRKLFNESIGITTPVKLPENFGWKEPLITVESDGKTFITKTDLALFKNKGGKIYYVSFEKGNNENDGLSEKTAFKTWNKPLSLMLSGDTLIVLDEFVNLSRMSLNNFDINKNINIIGKTKTTISTSNDLSYVKTLDTSNVFEANRSNVLTVIDRFSKSEYVKVNSLKECDNLKGSFFTSADKVYVHHHLDQKPENEETLVLINVGAFIKYSEKNIRFYLENFISFGGVPTVEIIRKSTDDIPMLIMKSMELYFNQHLIKGTVYSEGGTVMSQAVKISKSKEDGFDYHPYNNNSDYPSRFIEIDCIAHANGSHVDVQGDNGSTSHGGSKGIRIGGIYSGNLGPNIADVHEGTQTLNYNITSFNSQRDVDFSFNIQSSAEVWLFGCESFESDVDIYCPSGGKTYIDDKTVFFSKGGKGEIIIGK